VRSLCSLGPKVSAIDRLVQLPPGDQLDHQLLENNLLFPTLAYCRRPDPAVQSPSLPEDGVAPLETGTKAVRLTVLG